MEVGVGNYPITSLEALPAYYDGRSMQFVYKEGTDRKNEYDYWTNLIELKTVSSGSKIKIHYADIEDLLLDHPEIKYEYRDNESVTTILRIMQWRETGFALQQESKLGEIPGLFKKIEDKYEKAVRAFKIKYGYIDERGRQDYHRPNNAEEVAKQLLEEVENESNND